MDDPEKIAHHLAEVFVMLVCIKCKESKDESEFYKNSFRKTGYSQDCKSCVKEYRATRDDSPRGHISARKSGHKVCRKCLIDKPVSEFRPHTGGGYKSWCRACDRAYTKEWNSTHPPKIKERKQKRRRYHKPQVYDTCPICHQISDNGICKKCQSKQERDAKKKEKEQKRLDKLNAPKLSPEEKREKTNARNRARYANDSGYRATMLESSRKYQKNNRDKLRETEKRYRKEHRDKERQKERNREYRERGAEGTYTESEWIAILDKYKHQCLRCHKSETEVEITRDHIRSIIRGGSNYISNLQPLCRACNSAKGGWNIDYRPMYPM